MTTQEQEVLSRLIAKQDEANKRKTELVEKRAAIVQASRDDGREDLTEDEDTEFRDLTAQIKDLDDEIIGRQERVTELAEESKRSEQSALAMRRAGIEAARVHVKHEGRTYDKGNGRSYFQDLAKSRINGDPEARARLDRHAMEVSMEPEYRDLDRTDGSGGYFVPPLWMMQDYIDLARAGRPTANIVQNLALPPGTDSINVPKISTGTTTAIQTADNQSVSETDLADATVSAGVKTIAGQQDVAIQLLDQSPVNFDQVIFADLIADYATKVDVQVISGSNASGQVKGIRGAVGLNTITYTDTTPTVGELYSKLADAVQTVHTSRYMPPTHIVMHPRRWAWMLAALDSTNRPLVVPNAQGPQNAVGTFGGVVSQGIVGTVQGLPVVVDASIPTTLGTGTNEDIILVLRATDCILWESSLRTRVLPDVGSGTLTTRLQVYGYIAFTAERMPDGISLVTGSGLAAPSF